MDNTELANQMFKNMNTLRTVRAQRNIDEALQGESFVLRYIATHGEDDILPGEISQDMNVSTARIAQTLNSMEKKGLITRRIDENDRRKILIKLTPAGKELAEKNQQSVLEAAKKILDMLGEDDAKEYVRITSKLAELASKCHDMI